MALDQECNDIQSSQQCSESTEPEEEPEAPLDESEDIDNGDDDTDLPPVPVEIQEFVDETELDVSDELYGLYLEFGRLGHIRFMVLIFNGSSLSEDKEQSLTYARQAIASGLDWHPLYKDYFNLAINDLDYTDEEAKEFADSYVKNDRDWISLFKKAVHFASYFWSNDVSQDERVAFTSR